MRHNFKTLAMRDAALAALVGGMPGADFGHDDYGTDFGTDFGDDAPTPANMQKAWQEKQATRARERILEPNKGSNAKIQRYTFAVNQALTLGTAVAIAAAGNPETHIRPQRVTVNAPAPGFITLTGIRVANVGVIVGGTVDAFDFASQAQDAALDVPTLSPANQVNVAGAYTGTVPPGFVLAAAFTAAFSFKGPASMVA